MLDDLGSRREIEYVHTVLAEGTSADKQLAIYRATGDLKAVVRHLVEETHAGADAGERGAVAR